MPRELDAGTLGSMKRVTLIATYEGLFGWRLKATHQHEGDDQGCPYKPTYEGLTLGELLDVATSTLIEVNSRFTWDSTDSSCHPAGTPGSVGNALKLRT